MQTDYDDHGLSLLAAAVVEQAVDDWRYMCDTAFDVSSDAKRHPLQYANGHESFGGLTDFFEGPWCDLLCGEIEPAKILERLSAERDQAKHRNAPVRSRMGRKPGVHEYNGEFHTLSEWGALLGIRCATLHSRLKRGWTLEQALTHPNGGHVSK